MNAGSGLLSACAKSGIVHMQPLLNRSESPEEPFKMISCFLLGTILSKPFVAAMVEAFESWMDTIWIQNA